MPGKREYIVQVRLSSYELKKLDDLAQKLGLSRAATFRLGVAEYSERLKSQLKPPGYR
jgi:hypothetical protein